MKTDISDERLARLTELVAIAGQGIGWGGDPDYFDLAAALRELQRRRAGAGEPCSVCNALIVPRNSTHYDEADLKAAAKRAEILISCVMRAHDAHSFWDSVRKAHAAIDAAKAGGRG